MSDRHDRVAEILRGVSAQFIQQEANTNPLITVTRVDVAPNYRRATILVTTIPDDGEERAIIFLTRNAKHLRDFIKKHTQLKYIPHIDFAIDRGERHRQHIDTLVDEHVAPHDTPDTDEQTNAST